MTTYLYDALLSYTESDAYPLHMPGHKRRLGHMTDPFSIDITEIDGFDNLHHAEGILKCAEERAAQLYGSEETHLLVNGSTCGILTAISTAAAQGRRSGRTGMIMAGNCHKAALHGIYLEDLDPIWIYPQPFVTDEKALGFQMGGRIEASEVENLIREHPEVGAVMIVSPTYDGVVSDVGKIARICHRHGVILIVDEAHGAHFSLHSAWPRSSVERSADIVIHSLHKTLPSLTQTALLHVNGSLVDRGLIRRFLSIYQTSSPSYVLMASMDECIRMMTERGEQLMEDFHAMLERFYDGLEDLRMLRLIRTDDPSRIVIFPGTSTLSGADICDTLRTTYHLECEMAAPLYALALMSVGDDEEGLIRLKEALKEIDKEQFLAQKFHSAQGCKGEDERAKTGIDAPEIAKGGKRTQMRIREAYDAEHSITLLKDAAGCISGEPVFLYPPGIPLLLPGEKITKETLEQLIRYQSLGFSLQGMEDPEGHYIRTVAGRSSEQ